MVSGKVIYLQTREVIVVAAFFFKVLMKMELVLSSTPRLGGIIAVQGAVKPIDLFT